ncbi:MAG: DUF4132 domain-containing protein [Rhodocyclaceae bacterium]
MNAKPDTIVLPPPLRAALPPGEPGAKAPPKPNRLAALHKELLAKISNYSLAAELPEPLELRPVEMPAWLEEQLKACDVRRLGLVVRRSRQHAWNGRDEVAETLVHWLALQHGVPVALQVLLEAARWQTGHTKSVLRQDWPLMERGYSLNSSPVGSLWQFRGHWMRADPSLRADCVARVHAAWPTLPLSERVDFAIALPELRTLAAETLATATPEQQQQPARWLRWAAGAPMADIVGERANLFWERPLVALLVRDCGPALLPWLLSLSQQHDEEAMGWALAAYEDAEACTALIRLTGRKARHAKALAWACEQWPETALPALLQVLDEGKLPKGAAARLSPLLKSLTARLDEGLHATAPDTAGPVTTMAARDQWPAVLARPPWLRKREPAPAPIPGLPVLDLTPEQDWAQESPAKWIRRAWKFSYWETDRAAHSLAQAVPGWTAEAIIQADESPEQAQRLIDDWWQAHAEWKSHDLIEFWIEPGMVGALPQRVSLAFWNNVASRSRIPCPDGFVARHGTAALPGLLNALRNDRDEYFVAQFIGATELAPLMAQALERRPTRRAAVRAWLKRFPGHAATGLLPAALGDDDGARNQARAALRALVALGESEALRAVARRYDDAAVTSATEALLAQDPLLDFPARIHARSKLPAFWQPAGWRRPRLRESGLALPDDALQPLGLMLSFAADLPQRYAGLEEVLSVCEPQSVADFAWDALEAWEAAGASTATNWILRALGAIGTDDTARRLGALARRWSLPGGDGRTRIAVVLETMARLGSDAALLQLDALARKNRIVAVREQASKCLAEAAEARGLNTEQLQDRVIPDLGLDERGHLLLDFGPRQFLVGFDEALVPQVREYVDGRAGPLLACAPRPRASDDATLAAEAVARFKALKQDAATMAEQQPARLERAMCEGRSWTPFEFRQFLANHPLMRHLAQRLIWGVVPAATGVGVGEAHDAEQPLQSAFRVTAEGEWVDADDAPWEAPAGWDAGADTDARWHVVLAHPLQLGAAQIESFAGQLADYELIQPFKQLRRSVHRPSDADEGRHALSRWEGKRAYPGPLWGLTARGWLRGYGDGGAYTHAIRPLPGGGRLTLRFEPGLGHNDHGTVQQLGAVRHDAPLSSLPPIVFSEIMRDLLTVAHDA